MTKFFENKREEHNDVELVALSDKPYDPANTWRGNPAIKMTYTPGELYYNYDEQGNISSDWEKRNPNRKEGDHPETLFGVDPPKIDQLYADTTMRALVPTVLGRVLSRAQMIGTVAESSADLSSSSSPLVRRGMKAGLISPDKKNPTAKRTNRVSEFYNAYGFRQHPDDFPAESELPDETVKKMRTAGRQAVKTLSESEKASKKKAQPVSEGSDKPMKIKGQRRLFR